MLSFWVQSQCSNLRDNPFVLNTTLAQPAPDIQSIQARQKATWESGDFGRVAKLITPVAEQFMARIELRPGMKVLDAACGTGNLAVIGARRGCATSGLDIASNLIAQARERARQESLDIELHGRRRRSDALPRCEL